ncbi:unnamed protein product [Owenia fusiformis]|uniref:G-protein coupled receptors family 3 profile domain-containing protein n=1 Tax=Owenia fusiformis TaxID=6347 RepID=A0A8S4NUZ1_OWEFU|nr:unnamed protein product [Owenia fusiformis]
MKFVYMFLLGFGDVVLGNDVTYPPLSELDTNKTNLSIGCLLPLNNIFGRKLEAIAQIAIDEINKRSDILENYNLVLYIKNTSAPGPPTGPSAERLATVKAFEFIDGNPIVNMIYGNLFTKNTEKSAYLTSTWNILQVAPLANSLVLSDKKRYPYFINVVTNSIFLNDLVTHFITKNKWDKVAIIAEIGFDHLGKHLEDKLKRNNVTVSNLYIVEDEDDPTDTIAAIKESGVRIIVFQVYPIMYSKLVCEVYRHSMYAPRYVWIDNRRLSDDVKDYYKSYGHGNCTWNQIVTSVEGMFGTSTISYLKDFPDTITIGGNTIKTLSEIGGIKGGDQRLYGYDAIWTMALTMNNTIKRIAPHTLEEFTYQHKNYTDIFLEEIKNLSFVGATGPVQFSDEGSRVEKLSLRQVRNGTYIPIGVYERTTKVLDFVKSPEYMWEPFGKTVPSSETRLEHKYLRVSAVLFGIYVTLSVVGIVICLVDMILMSVYRSHSGVVQDWPIIRTLVCFGCIVLNIAVILMGIDDSSSGTNDYQGACQTASWMFVVGYTLALGGMLVDSFATYHFYTKGSVTKSVKQELKYCVILIPCLVLDIILLILWQVVDPPRIKTEFLQKEYDESQDTIFQTAIAVCDSEKINGWRIVMIVYKAIVLLVATFTTWPAWFAAHGKGSAMNHYLGICVYVTVLAALIGVPVTLTLGPSPSAHYGVAGGFILLCTISTGIALLYTILSGKRDPNPNNVPALVNIINRRINEMSVTNSKDNSGHFETK